MDRQDNSAEMRKHDAPVVRAVLVFFVQSAYLQAALAALGVALAVWLYRIPSRDRPHASARE